MPGLPTYIIDFDSTLISSESLDELARLALADHPERVRIVADLEHITAQGMTGKLTFDKSLEQRLRLFRANRQHVDRLIAQLLDQISVSAMDNQEWFRRNKERIYVISGGFEDYIVPIAERLGLPRDHVFANRFVYDDQGYITGHDPASYLCRAQGKATQVAQLQLPRPVIMIGDGHTDYEVKAHGGADEFWAFIENTHRTQVVEKADRIIRSFSDIVEEK